jgi:hypothetical protein
VSCAVSPYSRASRLNLARIESAMTVFILDVQRRETCGCAAILVAPDSFELAEAEQHCGPTTVRSFSTRNASVESLDTSISKGLEAEELENLSTREFERESFERAADGLRAEREETNAAPMFTSQRRRSAYLRSEIAPRPASPNVCLDSTLFAVDLFPSMYLHLERCVNKIQHVRRS